jgi:hypothetical protein
VIEKRNRRSVQVRLAFVTCCAAQDRIAVFRGAGDSRQGFHRSQQVSARTRNAPDDRGVQIAARDARGRRLDAGGGLEFRDLRRGIRRGSARGRRQGRRRRRCRRNWLSRAGARRWCVGGCGCWCFELFAFEDVGVADGHRDWGTGALRGLESKLAGGLRRLRVERAARFDDRNFADPPVRIHDQVEDDTRGRSRTLLVAQRGGYELEQNWRCELGRAFRRRSGGLCLRRGSNENPGECRGENEARRTHGSSAADPRGRPNAR